MKILYSRTHFWFGLKAGGSIGHTAGVINGFRQVADLEIISNEALHGVDLPHEIVPPRFNRGWLGELLYNSYFAPRLAAKIDRFQPDFVYHRYNGYSFATAQVCQRTRTPLVLEFNSSDLWKLNYWAGEGIKLRLTRPFRHAVLSYSEPYNLRAATLIVVVSAVLKESLIETGVDANRILVNPNGVDTDIFKPAPPIQVEATRQKLGIAKRKIVIGFIGTFGPWHGTEVLGEAFGRLLQLYPDYRERVHLLLIGDGMKMAQTKANLEKYSAVDACSFTGIIQQEQAPDYLAACDILVSPHVPNADGTPFFGSPTKLFEYMAMGKGIVASDLEQIGEILQHNHSALLVKPGDAESLMSGINTLIERPALRKQLGQAARAEAVEKYTWRGHTHKIIHALEQTHTLPETSDVGYTQSKGIIL